MAVIGNIITAAEINGKASGGANSDITSLSGLVSTFGFKNRIIGGDFTTNPWQRGTSFAGLSTSSVYTADRWLCSIATAATAAVVTITKGVDSPTASQAGSFSQHCLAQAVTTAKASLVAGDYSALLQFIEGFNTAPFGFGQAGTRNVTLSFWVKGAKTGIHCVGFRNSGVTRGYVAEYTITTANTWEYKTITIPVDTAGTWLYDNGAGLHLVFTLASGAGSTFNTTANSWQAGNFYSTANQVNELDTIGNNFKIALVQLEAGSVATPFDVRSVGTELSLCQRYYYQILGQNLPAIVTTSGLAVLIKFPVTMRAPPIPLSNIIDANFSATGGATGVQWGVQVAGVAAATKTGTALTSLGSYLDYGLMIIYGCTFSIACNYLLLGPSILLTYNGEL